MGVCRQKKYPPNKDTNIAQHRVIAIWKAATPAVFPMNVPIKRTIRINLSWDKQMLPALYAYPLPCQISSHAFAGDEISDITRLNKSL